MSKTEAVVYGLDIGVYETGLRSQVLSRTTAAWCRVDVGLLELESVVYAGNPTRGRLSHQAGLSRSYNCGRSIAELANCIAHDVRDGRSVALGFEAPMWLPLEHRHGPNLNLFRPRFERESGLEWYLQSGAAATLKAVVLGTLLREHLHEALGQSVTYSTSRDSRGDGTIVLYEAFVAGSHKVAPAAGASGAANEWDALTAALAWGALHCGFETPPSLEAEKLHEAGSLTGSSLSVWNLFLTDLVGGPPDCEVVAFAPRKKAIHASNQPVAADDVGLAPVSRSRR